MDSVSTFKNDKQGNQGKKMCKMNRKKLHSEKDMIKNTHNLKNKMMEEERIIFSKEQRFRESLFNAQKGNEKLAVNQFEKLDKASNLAYTQQQQ